MNGGIGNQDHARIFGAAAAVAGFAVVLAASLAISREDGWAAFLPLIVLAGIVGLWVVAQACQGSRPALLAYFAVVAFMTDAMLRPRGAGETSVDWQSLLKFAIWLGAGLIGWVHMPPWRQVLLRPAPLLLLAYIIVCLFSAFYAPSPSYSFGCAISVLALYAFAYALIGKLPVEQILWTAVLSLTLFFAIGWVVFYIDPELGSSPFTVGNGTVDRFAGIAGQADNMGSICAKYLGAIFLLWRVGQCRLYYAVPLAALGVVSLIASDARTGMIALACGIGTVMLPRTRWGFGGVLLIGLSGFLLIQVMPAQLAGLLSGFSRSGDPSELYTLTGRAEIWAYALQKIQESPLIGFGYNSSKVVLGQYLGFQNGLMVDTAHNLWLQNMLSVGLLGTVPAAALFALLFVKAVRRPVPFRDMYVVIAFVAGMADNQALGTTPTLLMLLLFMAAIWPDQAPRPPRPGENHA